MISLRPISRTLFIALLCVQRVHGSIQASPPASLSDLKPLPEIATLMRQVEANQKTSEATIRNYLYTSTLTAVELNGHGDAKKSEITEREVFYIDGVRIERTTRKNGLALTPDEQRKESERIDKEIAKAREKRAKDGRSEPKNRGEVTFARFLELGRFSNERRLILRGRGTIALDYTGDPHAKTQNALEGIIHDMAGTVFVDEQDSALSRVEGRFLNSFKVAGGLFVSVAKDTAFTDDWTRVNGEVWLPSTFTANGSVRALLFVSFNGRITGTNTNYRRFKTNSTILPSVQEVDPEPQPQTAPSPP